MYTFVAQYGIVCLFKHVLFCYTMWYCRAVIICCILLLRSTVLQGCNHMLYSIVAQYGIVVLFKHLLFCYTMSYCRAVIICCILLLRSTVFQGRFGTRPGRPSRFFCSLSCQSSWRSGLLAPRPSCRWSGRDSAKARTKCFVRSRFSPTWRSQPCSC